jgi:signal transduction histidine kinase/ligand-binding sensor domain-containing protein
MYPRHRVHRLIHPAPLVTASARSAAVGCFCRVLFSGGLLLGIISNAVTLAARAQGSAQTPTAFGQYFFTTISSELGMPRTSILTVKQTKDGALWVGTESGLLRFDGVKFVSFRSADTSAFISHFIYCLHEARDGALWIGTDRGVVRYRDGKFTHEGLSDVAVRAIAGDSSGNIWIGTMGRGLFTWRDGTLKNTSDEIALPDRSILSLFVDTENRLWIGFYHDAGVITYKDRALASFNADGRITSVVTGICESPKGTVWLGTHNQGIFRLRDGRCEQADATIVPRVLQIAPASDGGLWVCADTVYKIENAQTLKLQPIMPAGTDNPGSVIEDHEGNLWIGAKTDGLIRGRWMPFKFVTKAEGLPGRAVKTVAEDARGNLWLSVQHGGITRISPNDQISFGLPGENSPRRNNPISVYPDKFGGVWWAQDHLGYWCDGEQQTFQDVTRIRGLYIDRENAVWISSMGKGLLRYSKGVFTSFNPPDRLIDNAAAFAEAPDGTLFVGTWADGIFCIDPRTSSVREFAPAPPSNEVRALYFDRDGRLWAGLRRRGLALLIGDTWWNPSEISAAVSDHVSAIIEDDYGHLWMGSAVGVIWADKAQLVAAATENAALPTPHAVGTMGGPEATASWSGAMPTVWKTQKNHLLFATRDGMLAIDPSHLPHNAVAPPVSIEAILADRKPLRGGESRELPPGTRDLTIEYTAFSFVQPNAVRFKYRLDHYDADWIEAGSRRSAIYGNLPPGRYTFHVLASNNDGVWNETGASVALLLPPRWWQTWWIRAGSLLISVAVLSLVVRAISVRRFESRLREVEQQAALDRERARIARDLHDDLGTRLTNIVLLGGLAQREQQRPEAVSKRIDAIIAGTRQVIQSLSQVVWAINPRNDTLRDLCDYVSYFAIEFLQNAGISCRVEGLEHVPKLVVHSNVRHHVFLIVKETLHNIVRHAQCARVNIRVEQTSSALTLTIEDDGRGFVTDHASPSRGNGLNNMRQRMVEIAGAFHIESMPGHGTCVSLEIPKPRL